MARTDVRVSVAKRKMPIAIRIFGKFDLNFMGILTPKLRGIMGVTDGGHGNAVGVAKRRCQLHFRQRVKFEGKVGLTLW